MFSLPTAARSPWAEKKTPGFCARVCATGGASGCWTLLTTKTSPRAEWGWAGGTAARNTTARTHGDCCFWLYVLILSLREQRWICWESGAFQELYRNQTYLSVSSGVDKKTQLCIVGNLCKDRLGTRGPAGVGTADSWTDVELRADDARTDIMYLPGY